ncbi:TPA: glutamate formimidoyltransferase [Streptococcus pyogenes]|uniref:glutamate formimidoyltransferase n=1 Tax=Streptococcus pyogenes serotype M12 (strain MGAS9429) TaxID=370551 RepID=Q1JJK3_STRPC|nr:glutamate formimidoyltransferase [Streptococcus pyogenes]ABF36857.1 glutamate formiminotransferase [Streptococcus pyogenes MGAS2096]HEP6152641.1 glutamate formimidoyltransferase [Streptococcus pyogenes ABC020047615]HEP6174758.1 glutamate formimidoyltransferase [Streptococcus pyogenes ABC020056755]HEP6180225.1 glutamate formimidoyltransferase [Streptococcus pyogenes ABC020057019]HEP6183695.1 glutamate formimidoyltransferase [Streptococcus pyogenes ABC020061794]HEP6185321.1 glutamate formimi
MAKIVECIPNFSEGQNQAVIDGLVATAKSIPGVTLLDYSSDASHNRSVFTLVGDDQSIQEAAFQLVKYASENIDMTKHHGEHPRMGATDVCPFVPIKDITTQECVEISKQVAERINRELGIPIFLYEDSATRPERQNLAKVRKGQFEGMPEKLLEEDWAPDYGDRKIHPTAGITAVGARMPLVAFNVNLDTDNIDIAHKIAKIIRGSGGGYKYCKAIGVMLEDRHIAQVSMNMVNFEKCSLYRTFETIKFEARRYGVNVIGSEIIGLAPAKALIDVAEYYLQVEDFDYHKQILENHLLG